MLAFCRRILPVCVVALAAAGCSSGTRPILEAAVVDSTATVVVGDVTYALEGRVYTVGDDLTAVGVGTDAATGKATSRA